MVSGFMHKLIHRAGIVFSRVALALLLMPFSGSAGADEADPLVVFAAASTREALALATRDYTAQTGIPVVVSHASSAALARQIEQGAPVDVFLSANMAWVAYLEERAMLVPDSRTVVATNRLVIIAPVGRLPGAGADWSQTLLGALGTDERLALGDPDHVPAGIYARQGLEAAGLWPMLEGRLARTADVRGALALVARGEVPVGIVYATDAQISSDVAVVAVLPDDLHDPIVYVAALVAGGREEEASAFLTYLAGPEGQAAFAENGFLPPGP